MGRRDISFPVFKRINEFTLQDDRRQQMWGKDATTNNLELEGFLNYEKESSQSILPFFFNLFNCEDGQRLKQVAQRYCGVSLCRDIQNLNVLNDLSTPA